MTTTATPLRHQHHAIGLSVIDDVLGSTTTSSVATGTVHPSILQAVASVNQHRLLLLQGPRQSGRTSLLLDLACTLASRTTSCRCLSEPCRCCAVMLITMNDDSRFPLHCQQVEQQQQTTTENNLAQIMKQLHHDNKQFDMKLLHRIRVFHVTDVRAVYSILLSAQGTSPMEQPVGGILIDELCLEHGGPLNEAKQALRLSQVFALAVDLAETVGRLQGERPVVVAATQNPQLSNFCSSRQVIQVAEHSSSLSWSCKQEDEAIESSWSVSTKDGSGNKAYYAILKSVDKGSRIVWKREE